MKSKFAGLGLLAVVIGLSLHGAGSPPKTGNDRAADVAVAGAPLPLTAPTDLYARPLEATSFTLKWTEPTGGAGGIAGYDVYRDGVKIGTSKSASFQVAKLSPQTTYVMIVVAHDRAGAVSPPSTPLLVVTCARGESASRSLRINVPKSVPVVRGIIMVGNPASWDARSAATDPELVALAASLECAVMGTGYWGHLSDDGPSGELSEFEAGVRQFARSGGHPELADVPWMALGLSNGGIMAYELNAQRPAKVVTFMANKGGYYTHLWPVAAALANPGILISGQFDDRLHRSAIWGLFKSNRVHGALWATVEEEGVGHANGNVLELYYPYLEAVARARLPAGGGPVKGPVRLLDLRETEGWLTDPDTYQAGFAEIAPYAAYAKDRSAAGWLPNRRLAYIFRAFASYHKATATASVSTGAGPVAWGTTITYTIGQPVAPWTSVAFYEGDVLLKRVTPAGGGPLSVDYVPAMPGYSVLHALVTFADGARRTTMPRRVFVRRGPPQAPAIRCAPESVAARIGDAVTFSASASGHPVPAGQWRKDGVNVVNGDRVSGATNTTLAITNVQAGDAGSYTFVATNAVGSVTSAAAQLSLSASPPQGAR